MERRVSVSSGEEDGREGGGEDWNLVEQEEDDEFWTGEGEGGRKGEKENVKVSIR